MPDSTFVRLKIFRHGFFETVPGHSLKLPICYGTVLIRKGSAFETMHNTEVACEVLNMPFEYALPDKSDYSPKGYFLN